MSISRSDVEHVAKLCNLAFGREELERFRKELGRILEYVEKLKELDTDQIEPTLHGLDGTTPLRGDVCCGASLAKEDILKVAAESERGHFKVPRVV